MCMATQWLLGLRVYVRRVMSNYYTCSTIPAKTLNACECVYYYNGRTQAIYYVKSFLRIRYRVKLDKLFAFR